MSLAAIRFAPESLETHLEKIRNQMYKYNLYICTTKNEILPCLQIEVLCQA